MIATIPEVSTHRTTIIVGASVTFGVLVTLCAVLGFLLLEEKSDSRNKAELGAQKLHTTPALLGVATGTPEAVPPVVNGDISKIESSVTAESKDQKVAKVSKEEVAPVFEPEIAKYVETVVSLECYGKNDQDSYTAGSGVSIYDAEGNHYIATNAHVVRAYDGTFGGCWVYFPDDDGYFYKSAYRAESAYFYDDLTVSVGGVSYGGSTYNEGGLDYALLVLTEPGKRKDGTTYPDMKSTRFPDLYTESEKTCTENKFVIGDKVLILGYPGIGGEDVTVTDGIISGFGGQFNEFIKTSAKIEHGNSGGLAIRASDGCPIGIPSLSMRGELESIGSILSYSFINRFVTASFKDENVVSDARYDPRIPLSTIPLFKDISWEKKGNAHSQFVKDFGDTLSFNDVCEGYTATACSRHRTLVLPVGKDDMLWEHLGPKERVRVDAWKQQYSEVVTYYDTELKKLGFTRNNYLYAPDRNLAIPIYDYTVPEWMYDGGVFMYGRINGDSLEVVSLAVNVLASAPKECAKGDTSCVIEVQELLGLFMSDKIPLDRFVALAPKTPRFFSRANLSQSFATVITAIQGMF